MIQIINIGKTVKTKRMLAGLALCCGIVSSAFAQIKDGESITMTQVDTIQVTNHKERDRKSVV